MAMESPALLLTDLNKALRRLYPNLTASKD